MSAACKKCQPVTKYGCSSPLQILMYRQFTGTGNECVCVCVCVTAAAAAAAAVVMASDDDRLSSTADCKSYSGDRISQSTNNNAVYELSCMSCSLSVYSSLSLCSCITYATSLLKLLSVCLSVCASEC